MTQTSLAVFLLCAVSVSPVGAQAPKTSADQLFQEATAATQKGDFVEAEFWLRELRAKYPQDDRWGLQLMGTLESQGRFEDAVKLGGEIRPRYAKSPMLHLQMGRLFTKLDRLPEALSAFQAALPYSTGAAMTASLYNMIGDSYRVMGQFDQALTAFRKAKEISGSPSVMLALTLGEKGDYAGEIQEYRAVLRENPNHVVALNNLAYAYSERGENLNEALSMARLAVGASQDNPYYLDTLGWVYFKVGMFADAEKNIIEALLAEDGNQETLRDHLVAVLDGRAEWTAERRALRKLLDTGSTPAELANMKALLVKVRQK